MKLNYYLLVVIVLCICATPVQAQEGFGTNNPNRASVIELQANDKGLLIPRVALTSRSAFSPISGLASGDESTATALLVYNTNTSPDVTDPNAVSPGFYYWNGAVWVRIADLGILGNTGTLSATDGSITVGNGMGATLTDAQVSVTDAGISTAKIADDAVTLGKMAHAPSTDMLLASTTAGEPIWSPLASFTPFVQSAQFTSSVVPGSSTTVSTATSGNNTAYQVNVDMGSGTTLGVVREASTSPTVNVSGGILSVNTTNLETALADGDISSTNGAITVGGSTNGIGSTFEHVELTLNANNGLEVANDNVQLGGQLTRPTEISNNTHPLTIVTGGSETRISDLPNTGQSAYNANDGVGSDRLVVVDNSGLLKQMKAAMPKFFYMPSIIIPTHDSQLESDLPTGESFDNGTGQGVINLYERYQRQFGTSYLTAKASNPTKTTVLPVLPAGELDYYITWYDESVFTTVAVSDTGILTYTVDPSGGFDVGSFMNIVFAVKP